MNKIKIFYYFKFLFLGIAFIFLFQAITEIYIIPIKKVLYFLGIPGNIFHIFLFLFILSFFIVIFEVIADVFYSIGLKKNVFLINKNRVYLHPERAFFTLFFTLLTYFIFVIFRIMPENVTQERILNLYVFYFIIINIFYKKSFAIKTYQIKDRFKNKLLGRDIIDKERITYWSYIFGFHKVKKFEGAKGEILYKQPMFLKIILIIILVAFCPILLFVLNMFAMIIFSKDIPDLDNIGLYIKIILGFVFLILIFAILHNLGVILSRRIIVYKNCILIPLPTFSDLSLFTLILPKSYILLDINDLDSYEISKEKGNIKFHIKGNYLIKIKDPFFPIARNKKDLHLNNKNEVIAKYLGLYDLEKILYNLKNK